MLITDVNVRLFELYIVIPPNNNRRFLCFKVIFRYLLHFIIEKTMGVLEPLVALHDEHVLLELIVVGVPVSLLVREREFFFHRDITHYSLIGVGSCRFVVVLLRLNDFKLLREATVVAVFIEHLLSAWAAHVLVVPGSTPG